MSKNLYELYENFKTLKKQDIKATERKMDDEIMDEIGKSEVDFLNNFLKKGEKIDGKVYKSIDSIVAKYKKKIGPSRIKNDPNLQMLAPILAAMELELKK